VNTSYSYDSVSHLLSVLHQNGGATIDGASYTLDNAGNRMSKLNQLNGITENYTYDPTYQLTQVQQVVSGNINTTESYSYDAGGNRLSSLNVASYTYNNSNQLASSSDGYSYTYDANGNTLTKANSAGATTYGWDFENRLSSITLPNAGGMVSFRYDPSGRRVQKFGPGETTNYLYDGANLLEEVDNSGSVLAHYTGNTEKVDEHLSELRSGTMSYYEQNGLGSVSSLSNSAATLANTYSYDSFGKLTASTATLTNPLQYTGREFDPETEIYYCRARYFDQSIGRFISEDPIRFKGGINFYGYALNNPVLFVDSFGLETGNLNNLVPGPNGETAKNTPNGDNASQQWPLNGSLWPGFTLQDGVCTTGPFANMMNNRPCVKKCCKEHDDCYTKFNCNASSFLGGIPGPCHVCNITAELCILTADKSRGGGDCKCSK
jgi:RHS repeat-associated protein